MPRTWHCSHYSVRPGQISHEPTVSHFLAVVMGTRSRWEWAATRAIDRPNRK